MENKISLDPSSSQQISNTIEHLISNFDEIITYNFNNNTDIDFYNSLDGSLIKLETALHEEISNYNEINYCSYTNHNNCPDYGRNAKTFPICFYQIGRNIGNTCHSQRTTITNV